MHYEFLVETFRTEIEKVLGVWSMFDDADLAVRPNPSDPRGRSVLEQMVHQCVSEDYWFKTMLDLEVTRDPLPKTESRLDFIRTYRRDASIRLVEIAQKSDDWWVGDTQFFDVVRSRSWVIVRRIAHTAHHRGQQTAMLRMLNRDLHSTYGPTADTGGLMQDHAPVIYPYPSLDELLYEESSARRKAPLPKTAEHAVTERPQVAM